MLVVQPDKSLIRRVSASEPFALVVVFLMMISGFSVWMLLSRAPGAVATLDTPMLITYQGKLTNASRITVPDSALNMKFAIYTSSSGASGCVWSAGDDPGDGADTTFSQSSDCPSHVPSTAISVTPSEGVVTVILGASPQNAIPDALFDDNSALYLGVTVGADSEMTPRIRLTATPYAFQAGDADLLDGLDSTAFATTSTAFVNNGNSFAAAGVIGTNDANSLSFETNNVTYLTIASGGGFTLPVDTDWTLTGGTNGLSLDGTTFSVDAANNRIGIGTAAPSQTLTVVGTGDVSGHVAIGDDAAINDASLLYGASTITNVLTVSEEMTDGASDYVDGITNHILYNPSTDASTTWVDGMDTVVETAAANAQDIDVIDAGYFGTTHNGTGDIVGWLNGVSGVVSTTATSGSSISNNAGYFAVTAIDPRATGTEDNYGLWSAVSRTGATGGTINTYGVYVQSNGMDAAGAGTSTLYGLYIESMTGADTNYAIYSAGGQSYHAGNFGIGDASPASLLTVGSGDLFQVTSAGRIITTVTPTADSGTTNNAAFVMLTTPADTTGTNVHNALRVDGNVGNATGGTNTVNLLEFDALTGDAQVTLRGIDIGALTGTAATEDAILVGSGWDCTFKVGSTCVIDGSGTLGSSGNAFVNGGNSFGASAILGTNDANSLSFETNNTTYLTIASGGGFTLPVDTDWTLTGGENGFSIDGTTFSVDGSANRVGIGDATPDALLDVGGDAFIDNDLVVGAATSTTETLANAGFSLSNDDLFVSDSIGAEGNVYTDGSFIAGATLTLADSGITESGAFTFTSQLAAGGTTSSAFNLVSSNDLGASDEVLQIGDSAATFMTVLGNGSVGIGTVSPSVILDIAKVGSGSTAAQVTISGYANDASSGAYMNWQKSRGTSVGSLVTTDSGDYLGVMGWAGVTSSNTSSYGARILVQQDAAASATQVPGAFIIRTSDASAESERLRITSSGNVGIGDTTPASLFTVGDGDDFQVSSTGNLTSPADTTWTIGGGVNGLNFDSDTLSIDATNNFVGIGTSTPDYLLQAEASSASVQAAVVTNTNTAGAGVVMAQAGNVTARYAAYGTTAAINNFASGTAAFFGSGAVTSVQMVTPDVAAPLAFGYNDFVSTSREFLRLTDGTAGAVFNEDSLDRDFRAETDGNVNGIFLDASAETIDLVGGSGSTGCSISSAGALVCTAGVGGWTDGGTDVTLTTSTDNVGIGGASLGKLSVDGDTDEIQLLVQGNSSQTANYMTVETSAGTDLFQIDTSGNVILTNDLGVGAAASSETLANTGFSPNGDDLFVADSIGAEGNVYTDGSFIAGATLTLADSGITESGAFIFTSQLASGGTTSSAFNLVSSNDLGAADELLQIGDSAGTFMTFLGNGNVGIGTVNPSAPLTVVGGADVNLAADDNFVIDGSTNQRTITLGAMRFLHTPAIQGTRAINLVVDANNQSDTSGIVVDYAATNFDSDQNGTALKLSVDSTSATGGEVRAIDVTKTAGGTLDVYAVQAGVGVTPLRQVSGTFGNVDTALIEAGGFTAVTSSFNSTGTDVQMFVANGDRVYVGADTTFGAVSFVLATVASGAGVKPTFEFSTGAGWTSFGPNDGTNGMRTNGSISWDAADLATWATQSVNATTKYWIRITRTQAALTTPPTEDIVQYAAATNYTWDVNGDLAIRDLAVNGGDLTTSTSTFNLAASVTTLAMAGGSGSTGCTIDSSGNLACSGTVSGSGAVGFVNGGNSFGASAILGTNDANSLSFETNNTTYLTIASGGGFTLPVDTDWTLTGGTNGLSFDGTTFSVDATNNRIGIGTAAPTTELDIVGSGTGYNFNAIRSTNGNIGYFSQNDTAGTAATSRMWLIADGVSGNSVQGNLWALSSSYTDAFWGSYAAGKVLLAAAGEASRKDLLIAAVGSGTGGKIAFHVGGLNEAPLAANERAQIGATEFVVNDSSNNYDFRVEGDTNANLLFLDASADRVGIGDATPDHFVDIEAGSLASAVNALSVTGTLSSTAAAQTGVSVDITGAGSDSNLHAGLAVNLGAGYTGAGASAAMYYTNYSAGTATTPVGNGNGNYGVSGFALGTTTGTNVSVLGSAGYGDVNYGVMGKAQVAKTSAKNVAVAGVANAAGGSGMTLLGGYFGINSTAGDPTLASAALIADNGDVSAPIFLARDNGTVVLTVADGGSVGIGDSTPASLFTVGDGDDFQVGSDGDLDSIKSVAYSWPSANASGVLTNNGSGVLSWSSAGSGDITAVGSMTSGDAFADATADDDWLGLGAAAGRIEFDDVTNDEVNVLDAYLGVGTSTPAGIFHVSAADPRTRVTHTSTTGYSVFDLYENATAQGSLTTYGSAVGGAMANDFVISGRGTSDLVFASADDTERMRIAAGGNVGVGDATPDGFFSVGTTSQLQVTSAGNLSTSGTVTSTSSSASALVVDTTTLVVDASANRVGVGTASPAADLHVSAADTRMRVTHTSTTGYGQLDFYESGTVQGDIVAYGSGVGGALENDFVISSRGTSDLVLASSADTERLRITAAGAFSLPADTDWTLTGGVNGLSFDGTTFSVDATNNRIGIGDASPSALLTVGDGDKFKVNAEGDITSAFTTLDGSTTANGAGSNSTTLILTSATNFDVGNYVQVAATACAANPCFAKITAIVTNTLTVSPAISWSDLDVVTEVHVPEIGGLDLTQALANRYGRGYFIDGIVAGNGSTYITDGSIESVGALRINASGNQAVTFGTGTVTVNGPLVTAAGNDLNVDSGTLFVDSTNNRVGIGTATPGYLLDVAGAMRVGVAGTDGQIRLYSEQGATDYEVVINPNAAMTQNVTYTLPADDGTSSQVLTTDGSGGLSWATAGGSGANVTLSNLTTVALNADLLPSASPSTSSSSRTTTVAETTTSTGTYSDMAVPADGLPVLSHTDASGYLRVSKCSDANCSSGSITNTIVDSSSTFQYTSVAISADGYPVISYYDSTNLDLKVTKCGNAACSSGNTTTTLDSSGTVGQYTSIAVPADGYPVISYLDGSNGDLKVLKCGNAACSSGNTATTVDSTGSVGLDSAIAISGDGYPVVSYRDSSNGYLKVTKCGNAACSSGNTTTDVDTSTSVGNYTSIAVPAADSLPIISYYDANLGNLKVLKCGVAACSSGNTTTTIDSSGDVGSYTSIAVPSSADPLISYYDVTNANFKVVKCGNATCSSGNTITTLDSTGTVGQYTSIAIQTDNLAIASYYDATNGDLKVLKCANASCTSATSTSAAVQTGDTGQYSDVAVPSDALPVISYYDATNADLKVLKCGDSSCSAGNTLTIVDSTGDVGQYSSIAISADGYPVISYYDNTNGDLKVLKCGNAACSSGNTTTTVVSTGSTGTYTSIAVPSDGFPVVSFHDSGFSLFRMVKCGNAACSSGNTTASFTSSTGGSTSIAISADGYPILSFYAANSTDFVVVKCGNAACSSGNTTTTVDSTGTVGEYNSIIVPADGLPVASYHDNTNGDLKVIKCGNAACSSGNTTTTVDSTGTVGLFTSISLPTGGLPIISYRDSSNGYLKTVKCGNAFCSSGNIILTLDTTVVSAYSTSVAVSSDGLPIITHYASSTLRVTKCVDGTCSSTATSYSGGKNIGGASQYFNNVYAANYYGKRFYIEGFDLAESYAVSDRTIGAGEIVRPSVIAQDGEHPVVERSVGAYDPAAIGVVSTKPGIRLSTWSDGEDTRPVALAGRVPLKVNFEGGAIAVGDPVTSSSVPGEGMRAAQPGMIVGYALTSYNGPESGTITVFVAPGFHMGDSILRGTGASASAEAPGVDSFGLALRGSGWDGETAQAVAMKLVTDVIDAATYGLSIRNQADAQVAYITDDGAMSIASDMVVGGKLFLSALGVAQTDVSVFYGGADDAYIRTDAAGWAASGEGYAELFPSSTPLAAGEVVAFDTAGAFVKSASGEDAMRLAGVVSTRPGFLSGTKEANTYPIALAGRVPTNVSTENGDIAVGDALTVSATRPGYAMKATQAGMIIGYALEPFDGSGQLAVGSGEGIIAFVHLGYWPGMGTEPDAGTSNQASAFSGDLTTLTMNGNIYMQGNQILNVGAIAGLGGVWSVNTDGLFATEGSYMVVIESYQGEKVETVAPVGLEHKVTLSGTGTLSSGTATIAFEQINPSFNDITSTISPVRVLVTLRGPANGIFVETANHNGFSVRETMGGASDAEFDWYVEAYRKDHDPIVAEVPPEEPPAVEEPPVEEPVVEEPPAEEPPVEEPQTEEPPAEEPIVEEPPAEAPAEEPPPAEAPPAEEPPAEEPAPTEPAPTEPPPEPTP